MQLTLVIAVIFALIVAIFAVQNSGSVDLRFLQWEIQDVSLVLVILGSVALGALLIFLLGLVKQIKMVRKVRELEWKNKQFEEKIAQQETEKEKTAPLPELETEE